MRCSSRYVFHNASHQDGSVSQWHVLDDHSLAYVGSFTLPALRITDLCVALYPQIVLSGIPRFLTHSHLGRRHLLRGSTESGIRIGTETPIISNDAANREHFGFLWLRRRVFPPIQLFRHITCRRTGTLHLRRSIPYELSFRDYQIFFAMSFSMTSSEASFSRIRLLFSPSARAQIDPFTGSMSLRMYQSPRFSSVPIQQLCVVSSG